jgi:hypothetical protein
MELISANGKTYIKDVDEASPAHAAKLRPGMLVSNEFARPHVLGCTLIKVPIR